MTQKDKGPFVIALTGLPSSGKGEAARALVELASLRGWRAAQLTFSDQIKEEARRRGMPDSAFNRDVLSRMGIEMREAEGPGVLAARIIRRIRDWPEPRPDVFIADGMRHPGEFETLADFFGDRLLLAAIESDPAEIARRLLARGRADESPEAMQSEAGAIRLLEQELHGKLNALGPNVGRCMDLADVRVPNHGTLEELRRNAAALLDSLDVRR